MDLVKNKGADQLRSYCEADLRLCFRLCRLLVFPYGGSNVTGAVGVKKRFVDCSTSVQIVNRGQMGAKQSYCLITMLFSAIDFLCSSRSLI